jgi:hypothetical protein
MKDPKQTHGIGEPTNQEVQALLEQWRSRRDAEHAAAHKEGTVKLFGEEVGGREQQLRQACDRLAKDAETQRTAKRADVLACLCQPGLRNTQRASLIATLGNLGLTKDDIIEELSDLLSKVVGEQKVPKVPKVLKE